MNIKKNPTSFYENYAIIQNSTKYQAQIYLKVFYMTDCSDSSGDIRNRENIFPSSLSVSFLHPCVSCFHTHMGSHISFKGLEWLSISGVSLPQDLFKLFVYIHTIILKEVIFLFKISWSIFPVCTQHMGQHPQYQIFNLCKSV